jgi:hypothetical protein
MHIATILVVIVLVLDRSMYRTDVSFMVDGRTRTNLRDCHIISRRGVPKEVKTRRIKEKCGNDRHDQRVKQHHTNQIQQRSVKMKPPIVILAYRQLCHPACNERICNAIQSGLNVYAKT